MSAPYGLESLRAASPALIERSGFSVTFQIRLYKCSLVLPRPPAVRKGPPSTSKVNPCVAFSFFAADESSFRHRPPAAGR